MSKMDMLRRVAVSGVVGLALVAGLPGLAGAAGLMEMAAPAPGPTFADEAAAIAAFRQAVAAPDSAALAALLGLDAALLAAQEGTADTLDQIRVGIAERLQPEELTPDRAVLKIGTRQWPFPFPLVRAADGRWSFDTRAGLEEIRNRRIGENELTVIETLHAFVDAQRVYASADHDGDGVLEYARRFVSSPGRTDGLYWPEDMGAGPSPAAAAIDPAGLDKARAGKGYFGYHFRILEGQGSNVAGGHHDYVINGNMIAGFAAIAWPVTYGETGVHTFVVNQAGIVYEKDLGPRTSALARKIRRFDPNQTWEIADE